MIRDCPRCGGPLEVDMGPADDPDPTYGVRLERALRCRVCRWSEHIADDPLPESEWRRRARAVLAIQSVADLDERARVLREQYGLEFGSRPC